MDMLTTLLEYLPDERQRTLEEAVETLRRAGQIYVEAGQQIHEVPLVPAAIRDFLLNSAAAGIALGFEAGRLEEGLASVLAEPSLPGASAVIMQQPGFQIELCRAVEELLTRPVS